MEPMMPAKRENLRNLSVKKFHTRFGQHFHSIAWYVDNVEDISAQLEQANLRLFNIVGTQVKPPHKMDAIWTHPRETPGQLEFALNGDFAKDPRFEPDWSNNPWREYPLGIDGASHCDVLGGTLIHEEAVQSRKQSAFVSVGEDSVVELILPNSPSTPEGQDLEKNGEGIYSLVFKTNNLSKAQEFLRSKQVRPEPEGKDSIILGPDQAFGMVVGFTQRALPNDPRK